MAATRLSALTELNATPAGSDEVYIRDVSEASADESKRITVTNLLAGGSGANAALSNLSSVAINTALISDTDITDDLGTEAIRWRDIYAATLRTGDTASDTLLIQARDVDGSSWSTFMTLTAGNTPTADLASGVTIGGSAIYYVGGTDVSVADGGTGASSLTDGGVLLGSGTGAITAMAVLSDSEMIVGNGSTDPVAESGATLRTSIGVGTGDSPQFTGLTLSADIAMGGANIDNGGVIFLTEQAEADSDVAGKGQLWVDTATPNVFMFTDDAGTDFTIAHNATATLSSLTSIGTLSALTMGGDIDLDGNNIDNGGVVFLKEQADADSDVAGSGQIWVNTATPNELYFTDDAGTDFRLGSSSAVSALNNATANELVTVGSTTTELDAETNLTFDGTVVTLTGTIKIKEQAEAETDTAGHGQLWVDTATPNVFMFTDDAGTDFTIAHNATATLSSLVTVGALNSGSITSGFGSIDIGSSALSTTGTITGPSGTWDSGGVDIASGDSYAIAGTDVLVAATLGSGVTASSLTSVGTLSALTMGGDINLDGSNIDNGGVIFLKEQADADSDVAGSGQIWVNTATPNELYFTDDAGTDFRLGASSAISALNNATANELTTVGATTTELDAEANLTFDGTVLTLTGTLKIAEQADAESDTAGQGQLWVDTATPNVLKFTDDAGTDFTLAHNATTTLSSLTTVGTIGSGTWEGTTIAVAQGGTGATSLTDGGILLGSGTGAITAMSALADGSIVVGDGSTDPVALAAFTSSTGQLKHERGGIETDISAIVKGGLLLGTGTGTVGILAVGSDDQILTLASGTATWADASGGGATFPATHVSTFFGDGDDSRIATSSTNGSSTFESDGMKVATSSTVSSHSISRLPVIRPGGTGGSIFKRLPSFRCNFYIETNGSDYTMFCGLGESNIFSTGTWVGTRDHLGFKVVRASDGDANLYATQGDAETENASSVLAALSTQGEIDVALKVATESTGGSGKVTSCNYYYSIKRANWSSATNLTSNGARNTETHESMAFGVANNDVAENTEYRFVSAEFGG